MKEIDRRGRTISRLIGWAFWVTMHALLAIMFFQSPEEEKTTFVYIGMLLISSFFSCFVFVGYYTAPRAYFSEEGVCLKYCIRKRFYLWGEIQEALVLEMKARTRYGIQTYYRFFLLTSEGTRWRPGDTEKTYRRRNRGKLLQIPLTKESREYVNKYHGKLFIDESHGKKILLRLVK